MSSFSEPNPDNRISINDVIRTYIQAIPKNLPPYDAITRKWCNEKLEVDLRKCLNLAVLPGGYLPVGRMAHVIRVFFESMDFDAAYSNDVVKELMVSSEDLVGEAEAAMDLMYRSEMEDLVKIGPMGVGMLMDRIHSYAAAYIREKKYELIYSLPDFVDRLKAADEHHSLLEGKILPPGFRDAILVDISEKARVIMRSWVKNGESNLAERAERGFQ